MSSHWLGRSLTSGPRTVLVTGGSGFVGSNFLRMMVPRHPDISFTNLDALTYAANPANLWDVDNLPNYRFHHVDITDAAAVTAAFDEVAPEVIVHFAAETHVDQSIRDPEVFVRTNVLGTFNLLEAVRARPHEQRALFHHVSTDEVYGSRGPTGSFTEDSPYRPSSPYSASKAASNHLVGAYNRTYGVPTTITNCSNNYGPYQFPEKLIPFTILNARDGKALPVYGEGLNVRDWIHVEDHCEAIWTVLEKGQVGQVYNVGGGDELRNIDVVERICDVVAELLGRAKADVLDLITFVADRPGHDLRYAVDCTRIRTQCEWMPRRSFDTGLRDTVRWYLENDSWVEQVRSGRYLRPTDPECD